MISPRLARSWVAFAHDMAMAALSFVLAFYLRLGDTWWAYGSDWVLPGTLVFTAIAGAVFWFMGLYRGIWRYASVDDLLAIGRAATLVVLIFVGVMFAWTRLETLPRSIPFINWFVLIALLGGPRFLYRLMKDRRIEWRSGRGPARVPVLLAGADDAAESFVRALARDESAAYRVVGILAERNTRVGRRIHGIDVMGTFDDLAAVIARLAARGERPQRLVLSRDDISGAQVRALLDGASAAGMTLARLPRLTDFRPGEGNPLDVRPVALEDLLGRPQTPLDRDAMRELIAGRRVLITGAGGSIGAELVRQIAAFRPAELVLFDHSEFNLYEIDREVARRHPDLARRAVLGSVRDRERVGELIAQTRPELVFHAAALKHVPMVEANPCEGALTNVFGTRNVADACLAEGVKVMVMVSTDKAINPTSVMGASKRAAEMYCQSLDTRAGRGTRFVTVRFGNVLGSTGSVIPLFQEQLAAGGPLTVTDPEMKRYFMTVREAVELILQASAIGRRGAAGEGRIFVLDMGEPVRIIDLARQIIRLAGLRPEVDIPIRIIGARPGEKLSEEPFHGGEALLETGTGGIFLASPRVLDPAALAAGLATLEAAALRDDAEALRRALKALVPEYRGSTVAARAGAL